MTKLKMTVVRGLTAKEAFGEDVPDHFPENLVDPCQMHPAGQEFVVEGLKYPGGFCNCTYADVYRDIIHPVRGGD
ncbi:MAG: hypothetical protein ACETVY_03645 [Candidatus Bathyarchaeia archaeon]